MKYLVKELFYGPERLDDTRDVEIRECVNAFEAKRLVDEYIDKGFELKLKRQKKDYDKIISVELFFERKKK